MPLLVIAEQGRDWGWASQRSITAYVVGVLGLLAFVAVEARMGESALIPLRIFRLRAASVTIVAGVLVGAAMFGAITVLPQYMQIVHGASPTEAGLMMLPMVLGMMVAGITVGQITSRTGKIRMFPIIGSAMAVVMMLLLSQIGADTPLWLVMTGMLFLGLGLGQNMQPLTIIVQNAVPPRDIGVATASATFFRQLGGTLGVAVFLSLLFSTLPDKLSAPSSRRPRASGRRRPTARSRSTTSTSRCWRGSTDTATACWPRCRTTPRSSAGCRTCWRTRSARASPTRWTWSCSAGRS